MAITEDKLSTHVQRGENGGRELQHAGVVRRLTDIGVVRSGNLETSLPVKLDPAWREELSLMVLVQASAGGPWRRGHCSAQ